MILLKFGTEIKGDSVVEDHVGWITVDSFQMGVGRGISSSGGGKDRDVSNPSFSEVTITKSTDAASTSLFAQAAYGKALGLATLHFIQIGGDKLQVFLKYELTDAIISGYSVSSGGDRPSESLSLNFTKIAVQYDAFSGDTVTAGKPAGFDLMANKPFATIA